MTLSNEPAFQSIMKKRFYLIYDSRNLACGAGAIVTDLVHAGINTV